MITARLVLIAAFGFGASAAFSDKASGPWPLVAVTQACDGNPYCLDAFQRCTPGTPCGATLAVCQHKSRRGELVQAQALCAISRRWNGLMREAEIYAPTSYSVTQVGLGFARFGGQEADITPQPDGTLCWTSRLGHFCHRDLSPTDDRSRWMDK